ncbi:MAG TPA: hypothetical protein VFE24_03730, partial [Pirellulales bacterium]|nr:hypothetical protein [Pirellulales bacterium]
MIKRNPITLATFFRDTYLAAHPQPAANHKVYRGLIKAFSKLLGHEATLTDFTEENLSAFCATRKDAAGTEYQMVTLWRFAFQLGLIGTPPGAHRPYSQRRQIPQQPIKPPARDREAERGCRMKPAKTTRKPAAMLLSTLANEYARERHLSPVRVTRFRTTVRKFSLLCGRPATIDDLRQENLQPLREKPKKGKKTSGRNEILELLTILWTYAAKRFPLKQIPRRVASQRAAVAAAEAAMIPVPETPLMPLRSFLEQSYFACHDLKLSSIAAFRLAVMDFGNHLGETATLADLNQPAVDQYGDRRRAEGYAPPTVQTRLALLEAVWRFAYELGATTIAPPPIVRKINPKFVTRKPKPKPKPITPVEESPQEKSRRQQQFAAIQDPLSLACFYHRAAEEMKVPKARRWNRMEAIHALSWLLGRNSTTDDLSHENLAAVKLACGMKVTASER